MKRAGKSRVAAAASLPRTLLLTLLALAFLLQGLVVQTHIHSDAPGVRETTFGFVVSAPQDKHAPAVPDDQKHCPFCQEATYAGAFVAPGPLLILLPTETFSAIPLELVVPAYVDAASHFWRGRAPPKH